MSPSPVWSSIVSLVRVCRQRDHQPVVGIEAHVIGRRANVAVLSNRSPEVASRLRPESHRLRTPSASRLPAKPGPRPDAVHRAKPHVRVALFVAIFSCSLILPGALTAPGCFRSRVSGRFGFSGLLFYAWSLVTRLSTCAVRPIIFRWNRNCDQRGRKFSTVDSVLPGHALC